MKIKKLTSVYISCDDYCWNEYRIRVFKNFTQAMAFIKKTFFKCGEYPSYSLEFKNITNLKTGEYEILNQTSFGTGAQTIESFNVRDIRIIEEMFAVDEKGYIASFSDFNPTNYIIQSN